MMEVEGRERGGATGLPNKRGGGGLDTLVAAAGAALLLPITGLG